MRSTRTNLRGLVFFLIAVSALAAGCDGSNLRGNRIAGTFLPPQQPDSEAELAALWLSGELVAPEDLARTITADLTGIREAYADSALLASVTFYPPWVPSEILVRMTPEGVQKVRDGTYHEFDDLCEEFGLAEVDTGSLWPRLHMATLRFNGFKHPGRLAGPFSALSEVEWAEPNGFIGDWGNVYPWEISGGMSYLVRYAWGDCPAGCIESIFWYFRVSGGEVEFVGRYHWREEPEPAWWGEGKTAFYAYKGPPPL